MRKKISASRLVVGLKCGGSDGFSGITANPLVGRFADKFIASGGSCVLTEVPEMFGSETILMDRCRSDICGICLFSYQQRKKNQGTDSQNALTKRKIYDMIVLPLWEAFFLHATHSEGGKL